jgi:hypothetical protein
MAADAVSCQCISVNIKRQGENEGYGNTVHWRPSWLSHWVIGVFSVRHEKELISRGYIKQGFAVRGIVDLDRRYLERALLEVPAF